ncbi:MAG: DUF983 domain-containing protein [Hyphomonadaceae bacterium]
MNESAGRAPVLLTFWRGARLRCPSCGAGALFRAYLKLNTVCATCGADFSRSETADVAPYLTTLLIGLTCMPFIVALALNAEPATAWLLGPALAITSGLALALLPRVKGVLAALLWRARREI